MRVGGGMRVGGRGRVDGGVEKITLIIFLIPPGQGEQMLRSQPLLRSCLTGAASPCSAAVSPGQPVGGEYASGGGRSFGTAEADLWYTLVLSTKVYQFGTVWYVWYNVPKCSKL